MPIPVPPPAVSIVLTEDGPQLGSSLHLGGAVRPRLCVCVCVCERVCERENTDVWQVAEPAVKGEAWGKYPRQTGYEN